MQESVNGGAFSTLTTTSSESTLNQVVNDLSMPTTYGFRVQTTDNLSQVTYSNSVSFSTPAALEAAASVVPQTVNAGQPTVFGCTSTGGVGPLDYSWSFGDGQTGIGANPSHSYTSAGTYTATCTVVDKYGLSTTSTVIVNVNPNPTTVAGLPPSQGYTLFGAIVGAAIIIVIVVVALSMRSRKRSRDPPSADWPVIRPRTGKTTPLLPHVCADRIGFGGKAKLATDSGSSGTRPWVFIQSWRAHGL